MTKKRDIKLIIQCQIVFLTKKVLYSSHLFLKLKSISNLITITISIQRTIEHASLTIYYYVILRKPFVCYHKDYFIIFASFLYSHLTNLPVFLYIFVTKRPSSSDTDNKDELLNSLIHIIITIIRFCSNKTIMCNKIKNILGANKPRLDRVDWRNALMHGRSSIIE